MQDVTLSRVLPYLVGIPHKISTNKLLFFSPSGRVFDLLLSDLLPNDGKKWEAQIESESVKREQIGIA